MNFFDAIKNCLFKKYRDFEGRATRSEYWYFSLFVLVGSFLFAILDAEIAGYSVFEYEPDSFYGISEGVFTCLILIPSCAVGVRRLHDINKSGYWILLYFTLIGWMPLVYWGCQPSDLGQNKYGEDPLWFWRTPYMPHLIEKKSPNRKLVIRKFLIFTVVIPLVLILQILIMLGFASRFNLTPDSKVLSNNEFSYEQKNKLVSNGILKENDTIIYFYSEGLFSILEGGSVLTENRVIIWEDVNNELLVNEINIDEIEAIETEGKGSFIEDSVYVIYKKNDKEFSMPLVLSTENGGDEKFINELYDKILNY